MNYPVWELYYAGGGLLIAIIAVVHVYVAHFAVGGGLFLVFTEMKGYRENAPVIVRYTQKHSKFFLLLTMVFGAVTGVGIWFTIALISPQATSALIHIFVFGFAAEWVCFTGEIVALFIYYYRFGKMDRKNHLKIGWLYFIFAWFSLFFINGIITFMLTPGDWLSTHDFWDGFYNPGMWPSLFFRTATAFVFAGLFGFITAVFIKENDHRETMVRYCAKWILFPFLFIPLFAYWYLVSLPAGPKAMILGQSPEIIHYAKVLAWILPSLFIGTLVMAIRIPGSVKKLLAFILLIIGLVYMGTFEWIREASRRPYLIYHYIYSNAIRSDDENHLNEQGVLKTAKWVKHKTITKTNELKAGREIFRLQCLACHSVDGPSSDILPLTEKYSVFGMDAQLNGQGKINTYMPRFMGTRKERMALAKFIVENLHGKKEKAEQAIRVPDPVDILPFDPEMDEYLLLSWSDFGMTTMSDNDAYWTLKPPGNDLFAQLIRRGETPEIVTEDVVISYTVTPGFENPSRHVKFWDYAESLVGKKLPLNFGLSGNGINGEMKLAEEQMMFTASRVPVVPYDDNGLFNPYRVFTITAKVKNSSKILAQTKMVSPVSTEIGCKNCHGGNWRVNNVTGLSDETAKDVLTVHDRISKTDLSAIVEKKTPVRCQSCHSDSAPGTVDGTVENPELLNLSTAIHGFHANHLTNRGGDACHACHPSSPTGGTRFFRGIHSDLDMNCTDCHGRMEDLSLSLLVAEKKAGKKGADRLMRHLSPRKVRKVAQVKPRIPWINQPDCMNCHMDFEPPETDESEFNLWTKGKDALFRMRADDAGIMCAACHGSTHALYPARNFYGAKKDNIQPLQYQKNPYPIGADKNCRVCHTIDMDDPIHHPNMLGMFRNTW